MSWNIVTRTGSKLIPSFSIATVFDFMAERAAINSAANLSRYLHGEQDIIFHNPIPTEGKLSTEGTVTHIYDKGAEKRRSDDPRRPTPTTPTARSSSRNIFTFVLSRDGGLWRSQRASRRCVEFPDRPPDFEEQSVVRPDQPLLYRAQRGYLFSSTSRIRDFAQSRAVRESPSCTDVCTHGFTCRAVYKAPLSG